MCSTLRLLVLVAIVGCVELITVSSPEKYVNVTTGESVLLQCTFVTDEETNRLNIQWDFIPSSQTTPEQMYYYLGGDEVIGEHYKDRLQPPDSPTTTNNASVLLSNMQGSDSGTYTCQVHNYPDVDGKSDASIRVTVLEEPSTPYCSRHGSVELGQLAILICHSEHGSPTPTYNWIKLDAAETRMPVGGRSTKVGKLEIKTMSEADYGEYQCTATNVVGSSFCTIELSADTDTDADAGEVAVIAAAVLGALLGCVLIGLLVWFIVHTVNKRKYKEVQRGEGNEMRERPKKKKKATTPAEGDTVQP